mgnify:CR=1 FL=1
MQTGKVYLASGPNPRLIRSCIPRRSIPAWASTSAENPPRSSGGAVMGSCAQGLFEKEEEVDGEA